MSESSTAELLAFALDLADTADAISMEFHRRGFETETKADGTLVTTADRAVESRLRELVAAAYPSHAVLGEEEGLVATPDAPARWIIDPIDGTHGFARGMPIWATLIAVERGDVLEVGVASAPALARRWWAGRGLGAHRVTLPAETHEGQPIAVSSIDTLEDAHLLSGSVTQLREVYGKSADALLERVWRSRAVGDFWGHVLVAEGAADVMVEGPLSPWDIAALVVIVEEAGGRVSDIDGGTPLEPRQTVTTNGVLHDATLGALHG